MPTWKEHSPRSCPSCSTLLNASAVVHGAPHYIPPSRGDFTVCWHCGAVLVYVDASGAMRLAHAPDFALLKPEEVTAIAKVHAMIRERDLLHKPN